MRNEETSAALKALLEEYLSARGFELVEMSYHFEGRGHVLRLLADRPQGGITIDELSELNSALGALIDEKNIITERYFLEVNSPGLDRPLKTQRDFARNHGKLIKVFLSGQINGRIELDGKVAEVADETVVLDTGSGQVRIPLASINKAKLLITGMC